MSLNREPKHRTRPKKSLAEKARRQATQRRRLIALGMPEEQVNAMPPNEVRTLLRHPAKIKAE